MEHLQRQSSHSFGFHSGSTPLPLVKRPYAYSVSGGAGGYGTRISTATYGTQVGSSFGGDYQSLQHTSGSLAIGNEKITMQNLNNRLANYLELVRDLENANSKLEIKIREAIENKGSLKGRDDTKYNTTIMDLRAKVLEMLKENAQLAISVDNTRLASEDFKVKMDHEMSMRQMVEADVLKLRKILDDTNVIRLHLESDIESLKEELITRKKNHDIEAAELRGQISFGINVDVDAVKSVDLVKIMEEMRDKYEKIALKNQEEVNAWYEAQMTEVQVQVAGSTTALKEASSALTDMKKKYQEMEIELQSVLSLKASLEDTLRDVNMHNNMEVEKYNKIILMLQNELSQLRTDIMHNAQEYESLLNIKVQLEAEIAQYRRLLDGGADLRLEDAVDSKTVQTQVISMTQTMVDGKIVSESKEVKSSV